MILRKIWLFLYFLTLHAMTLEEQFIAHGYVEIKQEKKSFDALYADFDDLIEFLRLNPVWMQKLYCAKERFIRSKDRNFYSTDYFGLFDESEKEGKRQISFYYSIHFHDFLFSNYPEFIQIPQIVCFFEACLAIQKPSEALFADAAEKLNISSIFSSKYGHPPVLLKVVKYLPSYSPAKPHYDGTAFSLFLDSTDNHSLLLSPYKSSIKVVDFSSPKREFENSILLIPGLFLTEFFIYPTPHIVIKSNKTRYATIAFAMRPNFNSQTTDLSPLPDFRLIE